MNPYRCHIHFVFLLLLFALFFGCQRSPLGPILDISDISRAEQEVLGKRMFIHISTSPELFKLKPSVGPTNSRIYSFLQNQYNQVHHFIKLDRFSPEEDRWSADKKWTVRIIDNEESFSFCLPGGDLFLSTGILKKIENEAQLYALMSFEVLAMNARTQLERISTDYNSGEFIDIIKLGASTSSDIGIPEMVQTLINLQYETIQLQALDRNTYDHICNSSAYAPMALGMLNQSLSETLWIERKGYASRISFIEELPQGSCGSIFKIGDFQSEVKDFL